MSKILSPRRWPAVSRRQHRWALVMAVGLVLYEVTHEAVRATGNPRLLPAMVFFGTLVVPVTFLTFVWGRHQDHDVSPAIAVAVAAVGGCLSVAASAVLENAALAGNLLEARGQLPLLAIAVFEEGAKLLVTVVVLISVVPRTPLNGLLVGVATGTGFAILETLGYEFVAYVQTGGGMAAVGADLVTRSLYTPATHIAWAGMTGCAFGYAASRHWRPGPLLVSLMTFALVAILHTIWDSDPAVNTYTCLTILDIALLILAIWWTRTPPPPDHDERDQPDLGRAHTIDDEPTSRSHTFTAKDSERDQAVPPTPTGSLRHPPFDLGSAHP
jgi:RsiW-degrading membrane proteinase PrsW (M82 family)